MEIGWLNEIGVCSLWVWVLLAVGLFFFFFGCWVLLTIMLFSGGGGGNGLRSRFVFTVVTGYVVWVDFKFDGS